MLASITKKEKDKNTLREGVNGGPNDIRKIVETYQFRPEHIERYARRVSIDEIEKNGYNLNISRYVSTSIDEVQVDLHEVHKRIEELNKKITENTNEHNKYLKDLGLPTIY